MKRHFISYWSLVLTIAFSSVWGEYHSQVGQDKFINENFFKGKRNGIFLDVGAYDGLCISNTYFFEKELGWNGICIEPLPRAYQQLKNNRTCICINCLAGSENETTNFVEFDAKKWPELAMLSGMQKNLSNENILHLKQIAESNDGYCNIISLPVRKINDILLEHNIFYVDFLSIDIEGNELEVLSSIDFDTFKIHVMTVENNQREANQEIRLFLESKGFRFVTRIEQDEIYENVFLSNN